MTRSALARAIITVAVAITASIAPLRVCADPPLNAPWIQVFDEEFNGSTIDTTVWNADRYDAIPVGESTAHFQPIPPPGNRITTKTFRTLDGYVELRLRTSTARDAHTTISLTGDAPAHAFDIILADFMAPNHVAMGIHAIRVLKSLPKETTTFRTDEATFFDYHVYGIEWTQTNIRWFVDGRVIHTAPCSICTAPAAIKITATNTRTDIDWIRAYSRDKP